MKHLLALIVLSMLTACGSVASLTPPLVTPEVLGPVVTGKLPGQSASANIPYSNTGVNPVIATEAYVDNKAVLLSGGTISGPLTISQTSADYKLWLAKHIGGSGHTDAPKALTAEAAYLQVGGSEYGANTYRGVGFGYVSARTDIPPAFVAYQEVSTSSFTNGNLCLATRSTTGNVAPTPVFCVMTDGQIQGTGTYVPREAYALTNKKYVDAQSLTPAAKTAIKALTPTSSLADVIAALQK